jgi:hypothetical protein
MLTYEEEKQYRLADPDRVYTIEITWDNNTRTISWPYTRYEAEEIMEDMIPKVGSYVPDRGATLLVLQLLREHTVIDEWEC